MSRIIHIEGSHGELTVDAATGVILQRTTTCDDVCCGQGAYHDILIFDPAGFDEDARAFGATDILYTSAIYADGGYARAMSTSMTQRKGDTEPWFMADEVMLLADQRAP